MKTDQETFDQAYRGLAGQGWRQHLGPILMDVRSALRT